MFVLRRNLSPNFPHANATDDCLLKIKQTKWLECAKCDNLKVASKYSANRDFF